MQDNGNLERALGVLQGRMAALDDRLLRHEQNMGEAHKEFRSAMRLMYDKLDLITVGQARRQGLMSALGEVAKYLQGPVIALLAAAGGWFIHLHIGEK